MTTVVPQRSFAAQRKELQARGRSAVTLATHKWATINLARIRLVPVGEVEQALGK